MRTTTIQCDACKRKFEESDDPETPQQFDIRVAYTLGERVPFVHLKAVDLCDGCRRDITNFILQKVHGASE